MNFILVMFGGAIGSGLRYGVHVLFPGADGSFPLNTLAINVVGSFCLALLAMAVSSHVVSREWSLLLGVGLCGGFTTFSTFSVEMFYLIETSRAWSALLYALLSVVGGLFAAFAGYLVGRQF